LPAAPVPGSHTRAEDLIKNAPSTFCARPKDFAKNIERIMEPARSAVRSDSGPRTERSVAIAVVSRPFILIDENFVSLAQLLEFLFRSGVSRIFIWMKFDRKFAIRFLDIIDAGVPVHA
jgi:hypothetical protein